MKRLSDWLNRISTGRVAGAALTLFILFTALALPGQAENARATSGGAGSPDTSFFYTSADLCAMAQAYGEAGRLAYVQARFTFDAVFPLVYALCLATAISWLGNQAIRTVSPWQMLNLIPLAAMAFDYAENVAASLVMQRYPAATPVADSAAPLFTLTKWTLLAASLITLVVLAIAAGRRARTQAQAQK